MAVGREICDMAAKRRISRGHRITLFVFALVFFVPGMLGFGEKLLLFAFTVTQKAQGVYEDGRFAIIPLANYLLVFLGMLCLLAWAILGGMFRDIEGPKYTMLENERRLDEQEGIDWDAPA